MHRDDTQGEIPMRHRESREAISGKESEYDATSKMLKIDIGKKGKREASSGKDWLRTRRFSIDASCSQDCYVIFQLTDEVCMT